MSSKAFKLVLSFALVAHFVAVVSWGLPPHLEAQAPYNLRTQINALFRPYLLRTGLWQGWDMFAPNPRDERIYVTVEVDFRTNTKDGTSVLTRRFELPRMEKLSLSDRYRFESLRKWSNDHLRKDERAAIWPDTAIWILKELAGTFTSEPIAVRLVRHWSTIRIPTPDDPTALGPWQRYVFYSRALQPGETSLLSPVDLKKPQVMPLAFTEITE